MTKYHRGKGIMPGKGQNYQDFKGKRRFSRQRQGTILDGGLTICRSKRQEAEWPVRMQTERFHLPHTCALCSRHASWAHLHLPSPTSGLSRCPEITASVLEPSTLPILDLFHTCIFLQTRAIFSPVLELSYRMRKLLSREVTGNEGGEKVGPSQRAQDTPGRLDSILRLYLSHRFIT